MKKGKTRTRLTWCAAFAVLAGLAICLAGCGTISPSQTTWDGLPIPADWHNDTHWFHDAAVIDESKVDVFYVASTDVLTSWDRDGKETSLAALTGSERQALLDECAWFRSNIYTSEFNFFAPIYHQVTFDALGNPRGGRSPLWDAAADEVCVAFDHYMANWNGGRRFVLAGFSQGASILRAILKHMTKEQYARCVAAYAIGFQVTADDLRHPQVRPAEGPDDQGVIVSFNSVANLDGRWALVSGDAACSINPANWRTDGTPASFELNGETVTATLDVTNHVILVSGFTEHGTAYSHLFPKGNLHTYDRTLYARQLRENALRRSYGEGRSATR